MAGRLIILYFLTLDCGIIASRLNNYINHYEPFPYIYIHLQEGHDVEFSFKAFGQYFNVTVHIGSRVLDANTKFTTREFNRSKITHVEKIIRHLVTGRVRDTNESSVHGYVVNGIFTGVVNLPAESYYIELARYFDTKEVPFETIIYRLSDVNTSAITCLPNSNCNNFKFKEPQMKVLNQRVIRNVQLNKQRKFPMYNESGEDTSRIFSRASDRKICPLRIMVDHVLYKKIIPYTIDNIIAQIMLIIDQVDDIYRKTDFDNDGKPDDIGFRIVEFIIWWNKHLPHYKHYAEHYEADDYLAKMALYKAHDVCLLMAFTAQDFKDILGVAYIRGHKYSGGICSGSKRGRHMNVGVITLFPGGNRLSSAVAALVASHEIGHAFGSNHDPEECSPKTDGKFLMFATVAILRSPNCQKFSPCSKRQVNSLFHLMGTDCFIDDSTFKTCGNGVIDSVTEECDCGDKRFCAVIDPCCIPHGEKKECKYNREEGAICSYRHDACCTPDCKFVPADEEKMCNPYEYCNLPSYCDGQNKDCAKTVTKPDQSECLGGFGICIHGQCESIDCKTNGKFACITFNTDEACFLACIDDGWCISAVKLGIVSKNKTRIKLPDGVPCWDGRGYCKRGRCHVVTANINISYPGEFVPYVNHPHDNFNSQSLIIMALYITLALIYVVYCILFSMCVQS